MRANQTTILCEPDYQYSLFDEPPTEAVVNVASVPQRSPFRYPGGKTWLVPRIRRWLRSLADRPSLFLEPFAGGAIVGLTVAFEDLADKVILVERDPDVSAVWKTILNGDGPWLADKIINFPFSPEQVCATLDQTPISTCERAFHTILRNRVNRGGILAPGVGRLKNGENGKGLASRWYPKTLHDRILAIGHVASRICFIEGDGLETLHQFSNLQSAVSFVDPPYTASGKKAGTRLYKYNEVNHDELFQMTTSLQGDFLMTYDNTEGVVEMAKQYDLQTLAIPMKNTHHAEMTELLIGRNLMWA